MSTTAEPDDAVAEDVPELTVLGKRIEILRIERGVSKQRLARRARTSRQQLWRVMTGKSELTHSLRARLAAALSIEPASLAVDAPSADGAVTSDAKLGGSAGPIPAITVNEYLADAARLTVTLRTLPAGDGGRRLKRALLNALEDVAVDAGRALPSDYSEIHRRVLAGEL